MAVNQWIKTVKLLSLIVTVTPILSGCWDRLELEERAVVLAMSVDLSDAKPNQNTDAITHPSDVNPTPSQEGFRVSVQIAVPGKIPLGPGEGGGGGGGGKSDKTVWIVSGIGDTIDDALMVMQQQMSSKMFFGHLRAIIISEKVARKGLENVNDILRRNPEVRRMAWMMISRGQAETILRAEPPLERVPALYLISTLDNSVRQGKFPQDFVGIYWSDSSKRGKEGFLPYVKLKQEQNIMIDGFAIFKSDKMVGKSEPYQIASYMGIRQQNPGGYRVLIPFQGTAITVYSTHRSSKIRLRMRNGAPEFQVHVTTEVNIEEKANEQISIRSSETLRQIEKTAEEHAQKLYSSLVELTQRLGADIFGFGEYVRAYKPGYWNRNIKSKDKWQQMYPHVPVHVTVDVKLRRVGMKAQ